MVERNLAYETMVAIQARHLLQVYGNVISRATCVAWWTFVIFFFRNYPTTVLVMLTNAFHPRFAEVPQCCWIQYNPSPKHGRVLYKGTVSWMMQEFVLLNFCILIRYLHVVKTSFQRWNNPRNPYINPLAFLVGFHPTMIRYCLMHTLHLGLLHHVNGGILLCLMNFEYFGTLLQLELSSLSLPKYTCIAYFGTLNIRFVSQNPTDQHHWSAAKAQKIRS